MAGVVEPEETSIAGRRLGGRVPAATNTQATLKRLLGNGAAPRLCNEDPRRADDNRESLLW
jgi:hypothetical protein